MDRRGLRPMRALPKPREVSKQTLEQEQRMQQALAAGRCAEMQLKQQMRQQHMQHLQEVQQMQPAQQLQPQQHPQLLQQPQLQQQPQHHQEQPQQQQQQEQAQSHGMQEQQQLQAMQEQQLVQGQEDTAEQMGQQLPRMQQVPPEGQHQQQHFQRFPWEESQQPLHAAKPQPGLPQQTEDQEKDGLLFLLQIHAEKQEQQEKENPTLPSDRQQQPKQKKHAEKVQKEGQPPGEEKRRGPVETGRKEISWDSKDERFLFRFKCANEEVVSFQTTVKAAGGHLEKAARIARECYRKFESGASKSEVLILRNELYKDLPSEGNPAAAQPGCSSPKSE
ncbi:unnamed protein product, partial [Polarella glacialis]